MSRASTADGPTTTCADCPLPAYSDGYCLPHYRDAVEALPLNVGHNPAAYAGVAPRCPNGHEPSRMQPWDRGGSTSGPWFCMRCGKVTVP